MTNLKFTTMENVVKYPSKKKMNNIDKLFKEVLELVKGTKIDVSSPEFEINGEVNEYGFFMKNGHQQYRFMVCRFPELEITTKKEESSYCIDDFDSYDDYPDFKTFKRKVLGLV